MFHSAKYVDEQISNGKGNGIPETSIHTVGINILHVVTMRKASQLPICHTRSPIFLLLGWATWCHHTGNGNPTFTVNSGTTYYDSAIHVRLHARIGP